MSATTVRTLDTFTRAYLECALWASTGDDGLPLDREHSLADFAPSALEQAANECRAFQEANRADINTGDVDRAGHDFWLTRCGHGVGFWDGDWEEAIGERLTEACKRAGNRDLYVGDDGALYFSPTA